MQSAHCRSIEIKIVCCEPYPTNDTTPVDARFLSWRARGAGSLAGHSEIWSKLLTHDWHSVTWLTRTLTAVCTTCRWFFTQLLNTQNSVKHAEDCPVCRTPTPSTFGAAAPAAAWSGGGQPAMSGAPVAAPAHYYHATTVPQQQVAPQQGARHNPTFHLQTG